MAFDDLTLVEMLSNTSILQLNWLRPESRPLVSSTFLVERNLFGSSPAIHRFGNVVIHSIAAGQLLLLIQRLRTIHSENHPQAKLLSPQSFALAVAALWAMHPLQTESVAYIVQRGESLMGLFFFAFLNALFN